MGLLRRGFVIAMLIGIVFATVLPIHVAAYIENRAEILAGNVVLKGQYAIAKPAQAVFHKSVLSGTDAEAFAFSGGEDGITIGQSTSGSAVASDLGFYYANWNYLMFDNPGSLCGTGLEPIGCPKPVGSGLIWPLMTRISPVNVRYSPNMGDLEFNSTMDEPDDIDAPLQLNSTSRTPAVNRTNTTVNATAVPGRNVSANQSKNDPHYYGEEGFNHKKATNEEIQAMSAWDRLLFNALGGLRIKNTFNGTTSRPGDINPTRAWKFLEHDQILSDSMNMTFPGAKLKSSFWCL